MENILTRFSLITYTIYVLNKIRLLKAKEQLFSPDSDTQETNDFLNDITAKFETVYATTDAGS